MKKIKYHDRVLELIPYNLKIEKELLLYKSSEEKDFDLDDVLYILKDNFKLTINSKDFYPICDSEKMFILFSLRSISVDETLRYEFRCNNEIEISQEKKEKLLEEFNEIPFIENHCQNVIDNTISTENIFQESTFDKKLLKKYRIKDIISDNIEDFFIDKIEDYDVDEYDKISKYIEEHCAKFNFVRELKCPKCSKIHYINFGSIKESIRSLSEISIAEFYSSLNQLVYKGHYQLNALLNDIYPFEREIYISNLNDTIEEENKRIEEKARQRR